MSSVADERAGIGDDCLARGDIDGAEEAYRDAISADRDSVRALYGLAATLSRRGQWSEAIGYGRRALGLDASHVGVCALLGVALLRQGAAAGLSGQSAEEEAVSHLLFAVDHGAGAAIRVELARAYEHLERWEDAAKQLRLAIEEGPGDYPLTVDLEVSRAADLHYALSRVLAEAGRHDESQEQYERGLQLDPHMQLRDWYQYIATEFDAEHDPAAAVSEGDQEARDAGRIRQLLMVRSYEALTIAAASQRECGLESTVVEYVFATQRAGNFVQSAELRVIGDCIIGQGAVTLYELVHSDAGRMLLGLAEAVYSDAAQLEIAERRAAVVDLPTDHVEPLINLVERFVRLDPESGAPVAEVAATALAQVGRGGACLYVLGDARYRHGDLGGARQSLTQAIPLLERAGDVPGLLDALARMATVESDQDRFAQAVDVLDRLIVTAEQHDEPGHAGVARCNRAIDLFKLGDAQAAYDEARRLAEAVVADGTLREEIGLEVAASLAALLTRAGAAVGEALPAELLSRLAELDDNTTNALLDLAYEHLHAGRTDEAIALLKPAADSGTPVTAVLAVLGQAFAMVGDISQAEDYLHEALSQRRQGRSGDADLWPVLFTLAEIIRGSGNTERAIGWLSQALDVALTHPDPERTRKTLTALSFALVDVEPYRAVAIAGRVYGGIDPSSPLIELARECNEEWSAKRYPSRQLRQMQQLLDTTPVNGSWVRQAALVASTAVDVGAEALAITLAKKIIKLTEAHEWGDLVDEMRARSVLGRACRLRGRYEQSRAEYERAAEIAEMVFDVRAEADIRGRLAIVLRHLDRPDLAVVQYRQAIRIAERLDEVSDAAVARSNLVYSLLAVGREAEAISCAQQAIVDSWRSGQPDIADYVLRLLAHHVADGELPAELRDAITALPATIESEPGTFRWLYEHLHQAARLIESGQVARAVPELQAMLGRAEKHGNMSIRKAAHLEAARTLAAVDAELAWTIARQALTIAKVSETHVLFLADCRQLLLDLALATGRDGEIQKLVADLLADWALLRHMLPEDADRVAVADQAVRHLHGAVLHYLATEPARAFALWDTARAPALAEAISPTSSPIGHQAAHVLSLGMIGEEAVAMIDGPDSREPVVIRTGLGPAQLDQLMRSFRREMHVFHGHGSGTWMRLAAPLLAGAAEHLPPDGLVIAVLDATLQELPLHAVPMPNGEPLIARCAVTYAPSLAVLDALDARAAAARTGRSILTIGVAFPDEARAVTARFGGVCRSGISLGKFSLRKDIEAADLLHFACHGQFDSEIPINSGLVLATSRQPVPDEILSIRDLSAWALDVGLITLSACDTALGIASPSELLGLARSFLRIGAHSVLAALWKVDDAATQRLMLDFYAELFRANVNGRLDTARALRATQLRHADAYPPHAWAGFKLIGLPSMAWQEPT
jgi:tetratricopeptide (TPR) repeat protein